MKIGNDWKIESDENNITLFKRKVINGKGRGRKSTKELGSEYYVPVAYYSNPKNALDGIIRREINGTGLKEFKDVVAKIQELHDMIQALPIGNKI